MLQDLVPFFSPEFNKYAARDCIKVCVYIKAYKCDIDIYSTIYKQSGRSTVLGVGVCKKSLGSLEVPMLRLPLLCGRQE